MAAVVQIDLMSSFDRRSIRRKKSRMANAMLDQVLDRIEEGGDEDGKFAPLDFARPNGSTGNPLNDTGTHLSRSISDGVDDKSIWVGSNFIGSRVHQLGTEGKGGELPSIKPVLADALFIPLSPRAAKSVLQFGNSMNDRRRVGSQRRKGKKVATTLEQGKDFLLKQKVDIRPRRFLRLSENNRQELRQVFKES